MLGRGVIVAFHSQMARPQIYLVSGDFRQACWKISVLDSVHQSWLI